MKNLERRTFIRNGINATAALMLATPFSRGAAVAGSPDQVAKDFVITKYGAVGDSKTMNTAAIQKTIDDCSRKGGGRVVVPKGTFLSGGVVLKSNVELHIEKDAVILGSPYIKDYTERYVTTDVRYKKYLRRALVFAQDARNITVSGEGTLNGNAQLSAELGQLVDSNKKHKPEVERPCILWFDNIVNVSVKGITYKNSCMWTETYSRCKNVHVDGIKVKENYFFNADGCNMLDCDGFIIENCDIDAHDDAICLKGYTKEGCRNGIIRNNRVRSICNGIKMGTDSSGGFRDILIENNEVWQTAISGIALEMTDGGIMENIIVRNTKMNVVSTPIFIMLGNRNRIVAGDLSIHIGQLKNVSIHGVEAIVDKYETYHELERKHFDFIPFASSITAFPGYYVENVSIENVKVEVRGGFPEGTAEDTLREIPEPSKKYPENRMFGTLPAYAFYIRHARQIKMKDVEITMHKKDGRPAFFLDDVHDSQFEDMRVTGEAGSPAFSVKPNCSRIGIDLG